jgi:hypothetical protein
LSAATSSARRLGRRTASLAWWRVKIERTARYLTASVSADERRELEGWLSPAQLELFEAMHPADRRHGLDVVRSLRLSGRNESALALAGLFHDAGKGPETGLLHRVAWSLGERYGDVVLRLCRRLPGFAAAFERMARHAETSADLALAAGCPPLTGELIRQQATPRDVLGRALRVADEAN